MKRFLLVALVLFSAGITRADIVLEPSDDSRIVVYQEGTQVVYEPCKKDVKPARGCSGAEGQGYRVDADRYFRTIQSFFGLVNPTFTGLQGPERLAAKIQNLQQHLDHDELNATEIKQAEDVLLGFVKLRDQIEKADREVLQYLQRDNDTTFSEAYQSQRVTAVNLAFYPIVYFADSHMLYRYSEAVTYDQVSAACPKFAKDWSGVAGLHELTRDLRSRLSISPVGTPGEVTRVWTTSAKAGYWKVTCDGGRYLQPKILTLSPEAMHSKDDFYSRHSWSPIYGPCGEYYTESGREYVAGTAVLVDIGAPPEAPDVEEMTEAGERSISGNAHPVVCAKHFDFNTGNNDDGYLNGEHFADFSIYHLESSLESMAKSVYVNRAEFFRAVAKTLGEYPLRENDDMKVGYRIAGARLFVLLAIEPLLHDIQSKFVDRYVLPDYVRAKDQWSKRLGAESLREIDLSAPTYRIALSLLTYGLKASQSYLNADDKVAVEKLLPVLGRGMASGPSTVKDVAKALDENRALFDHITAGRRVHGFGVMATSIADYLTQRSGK